MRFAGRERSLSEVTAVTIVPGGRSLREPHRGNGCPGFAALVRPAGFVTLIVSPATAPLAQLAEHLTLNQRVVGSSPTGGTDEKLSPQCYLHMKPEGARPMCRRAWLWLSALGGLSLGFPGVGAASPSSGASSFPGFGRARSVILVFANGGQSQLDMWDPKPSAPAEVRGEFRAIRTAVPGILLSSRALRTEGASVLDIAPTILDLLGVPRPKEWEGRSLVAK